MTLNQLADLIGPVYLALAFCGIGCVFGYCIGEVLRGVRFAIRQRRINRAITESLQAQVRQPERWDTKYRRPLKTTKGTAR